MIFVWHLIVAAAKSAERANVAFLNPPELAVDRLRSLSEFPLQSALGKVAVTTASCARPAGKPPVKGRDHRHTIAFKPRNGASILR